MNLELNILIVEDNYIIALDIKRTLTKIGYKNIKIIITFEEGVNEIQFNDSLEFVIMDINLNNKDVSKTGTTLGCILNTKKIPFIYLTAYIEKSILIELLETKPLGYITKPFKRERLIELMKQLEL